MNVEPMDYLKMAEEAHRCAVAKGWWEDGMARDGNMMLLLAVSEIIEAVEEDRRAVYFPPIVRLLQLVHNVSPRAGDALLRRLRGGTAAPRRD